MKQKNEPTIKVQDIKSYDESEFEIFDGRKYGGDIILYRRHLRYTQGEPSIKIQGTTSTPTSNPFSRREFVRRIRMLYRTKIIKEGE